MKIIEKWERIETHHVICQNCHSVIELDLKNEVTEVNKDGMTWLVFLCPACDIISEVKNPKNVIKWTRDDKS